MKSHIVYALFLALGLFVWAPQASAQDEARIKFSKTTHEFGQLDKGDPAEHTFVFTNVSDAPVTLERVKASCGCTTPSYTKEEVKPGATGEIKVKYNSARVGPFTKSITVTYEAGARPIVLYIKGDVKNTAPQTDLVYKRPMGNLAFDELVRNFGTLDSDKEKSVVFKLRNNGALPIKIGIDAQKYPEFDFAISTPEIIPGATSTISVKAIGQRFEEMGAFNTRLVLNTSDQAMPEKTLTITGVLNKVYTEAEKAAMPNIEFELTSYDAGKVISGEKVVYAYQFKNTGLEDLVIESVKASCGCTATAPKDEVIPAGQSSEIVATFDTRGRQGKQAKSITVRSNDPDQGVLVLRLSAEVEADPFHVGGAGPAEGGNR